MTLLIISFIAGALTVLAPCILPLLPIVVGGAVGGQQHPYRAYIITASLAVSILIFTLLLKFSTALLGIPASTWGIISGIVIVMLGASMVWPAIWERVAAKLNITSGKLLGKAGRQKGVLGDIATGMALGPVFNSCSPTYALIVAGVLPASFGEGLLYLFAYIAGLVSVLLVVALVGQKLIARLGWASNPKGWLKRALGVVFILVGVSVASGFDRYIQTYFVQNGWYDVPSQFENSLLGQ